MPGPRFVRASGQRYLLRDLRYPRQASTMPCCQPPLLMQFRRPVGATGSALLWRSAHYP